MITIKSNLPAYTKIGIDEIEGLKEVMKGLMKPVQDFIQDKVYWSKVELEESEYKSCDGFIPYRSNCGGIEISEIIPKCEEYDWKFIEFGECDDKECDHELECGYEIDGHLDAKLRLWFKFEGIENNKLKFYLYMGGGNGDAPYFRVKAEQTYFEREFSVKSLDELKTKGKKYINELLKAME